MDYPLAYRFRAVQAFNPTFYIGTVTYNTKQFPSASSTSYFRDYMTNYRKVYEQPATYIQFSSGEYYNSTPTDNKWYTFRLDEPYYWDGEGNIVVGCYNYGANQTIIVQTIQKFMHIYQVKLHTLIDKYGMQSKVMRLLIVTQRVIILGLQTIIGIHIVIIFLI